MPVMRYSRRRQSVVVRFSWFLVSSSEFSPCAGSCRLGMGWETREGGRFLHKTASIRSRLVTSPTRSCIKPSCHQSPEPRWQTFIWPRMGPYHLTGHLREPDTRSGVLGRGCMIRIPAAPGGFPELGRWQYRLSFSPCCGASIPGIRSIRQCCWSSRLSPWV